MNFAHRLKQYGYNIVKVISRGRGKKTIMTRKNIMLAVFWTITLAPVQSPANIKSAACDKPANLAQRKAVSFEELNQGFEQPDMIYAPFAFWFWGVKGDGEPGEPNAKNAADMAEEMCRQRLNPGYAQMRSHQEYYLSPQWFKAFDAALKKAEAANSYLGYYDEYFRPKGWGDGSFYKAHPELKASSLKWQTLDVEGDTKVELPESFFTVAAKYADYKPKYYKPNQKLGRWIWNRRDLTPGFVGHYRRVVDIKQKAKIASAKITVTTDDPYTLYINGQKLDTNVSPNNQGEYDVKLILSYGKNVIGLESKHGQAGCGLRVGLRIDYEDGFVQEIVSDEQWRTAVTSPFAVTEMDARDNWTSVDYNDTNWVKPQISDDGPDSPPWHIRMPDAGNYSPFKISSSSLRVIGGGKAFTWQPPKGKWRIYSFTKYCLGDREINYLDRRLPKTFTELKSYADYFGQRMGKSIPGVFVDHEGDYGYKLAWSDDLAREYEEYKNRDVRLWMPLLIDEDIEGLWAKARWDWYDVVSEIYTDSFLGSLNRALEQRGMYAISNLWEESLIKQACSVGDFFKAQRSYSMPGQDAVLDVSSQVHDFKETQSVTEFEGRRFQSEILGVVGWQMTPVLMKKTANSVIAWGVSHVVIHGIYLERDILSAFWPPDWYEYNPYWRYLHLWTDFTRRASYINSQGHLVPDVLLLNPMDSVWALLGDRMLDEKCSPYENLTFPDAVHMPRHGNSISRIERVYRNAIEDLTASRIEYLIADSHYVRGMKITPAGGLSIGPFEFKAVLIPSMIIMPTDIAKKIVAFAQAGGTVYILGDLPVGSVEKGLNDVRMKELMAKLQTLPSVKKNLATVREMVAQNAPFMKSQAIFESGEFPMLQLHRRIDGRDFFWLANNTDSRQECTLTFSGIGGAASIWNCETGDKTALPSQQKKSASSVKLSFQPYEAFWLVFNPAGKPIGKDKEDKASWLTIAALDVPWNVRIDKSVQPPQPVTPLIAPQKLLSQEGVYQPLASWLDWGLDSFSGFVDYTTTFESDIEGKQIVLDLGEVRYMAEVWVNDKAVGCRLWPPYKFEIGDAVHKGTNTVKVRVGNLLTNTLRRFGMEHRIWHWMPPKQEYFNAGLFGPVTVKYRQQ